MRYRLSLLTLCALVACTGIRAKGDDIGVAPSPETFIHKWAAAFNDNNPEKHLTFYDDSDKTEMLVSAGLRHRGFRQIRAAFLDDQQDLRYYDSSAQKISARILGDVATVSFEHLFKLRILEDDSRWQVHIRTTSVLQRVDDEWKIVLEHSSPIRSVPRVQPIDE